MHACLGTFKITAITASPVLHLMILRLILIILPIYKNYISILHYHKYNATLKMGSRTVLTEEHNAVDRIRYHQRIMQTADGNARKALFWALM